MSNLNYFCLLESDLGSTAVHVIKQIKCSRTVKRHAHSF